MPLSKCIYTQIMGVQNTIHGCLGLFFPFEFISFKKVEKSWIVAKKIYAVLVVVLLLGLYIIIQIEGKKSHKTVRTSNFVLIITLQTTFTVLPITTILCSIFWQRQAWIHYAKLRKLVAAKLNAKLERNALYFGLEFALGHVLFLIVVGLDYFQSYGYKEKYSWPKMMNFILRNLHFYYVFVITTIIYNTALLLRNDFSLVKMFITNSFGIQANPNFSLIKVDEDNVVYAKASIDHKTLHKLLETSKILNILFELVTIFNDIFGKIILLITFATLTVTLWSLNSLLIGGEENTLTVQTVTGWATTALIFLTWNSFIISACSLIKKEGASIVKVTCKIQQFLPRSSQERHELLNLAHQVASRIPTISAYGFFDVDLSLIFSIFTCAGTYTVVLIQFSHIDF